MNILILGASGYIGRRLTKKLLKEGYHVRCLIRSESKAGEFRELGAEVALGDILHSETLDRVFENIDVVYYLIHSMGAGAVSFEDLDRRAAENTLALSRKNKIKRIIYLGGLGRRDIDQSPHLRSRHEVGDILRSGGIPLTEFRAAVIVGSGSISFEMIHHLVNRLPVMICPAWVFTRTQPVWVNDVLEYLTQALRVPESSGKTIDIGGPEILSYYDLMVTVAEVLGLRRYLFSVPVLTPRLSSYWVNLMTPISVPIARSLIESLRYETVCENDIAREVFSIKPLSFRDAVIETLSGLQKGQKNIKINNGGVSSGNIEVDRSHLLEDIQTREVAADSQTLFKVVTSIGGENGWYFADWLWRLRGGIDKVLGGVGLRRGRRDQKILQKGETLDFWRVEDIIEGKKLLLRAEMNVWGKAWLEFEVIPEGQNRSRLVQTARYYPRGLFGFIYWYSIYPLHYIVFRGLAKNIAYRAAKIFKNPVNA